MNSKEYIQSAIKTESRDFNIIEERLKGSRIQRLLHASFGLSTESGELLDALKKHIFYGRPLDLVNISEEMGDLFWYLAILSDELGLEFEKIMEKNIEKLKARYGHRFTENQAFERNLEKEREILEQTL